MVAKRHHYVPKCYLEAFSVKNPKKKKSNLYAFDSVERRVFRPAPDNVALQTDFNTIDIEGHEPDAFENAMASVESEIGPALARIRSARSLANEDDKAYLINLIGLLYIRNPRMRRRFQGFRQQIVSVVADLAVSSEEMWKSQFKKAQDAGYVAKDAEVEYEIAKKELGSGNLAVIVPNEENIIREIDAFNHALPLLFERKWILVKAPEGSPGFITSDHPVCLMWSKPNGSRAGPGLRHKGSEILFPISPELAVVGTFELKDGIADFSEEEVASANGTIARFAERQAYARTTDFKYQIDQKHAPRSAALLIDDVAFKSTPYR